LVCAWAKLKKAITAANQKTVRFTVQFNDSQLATTP
jgi:hypothetical protein